MRVPNVMWICNNYTVSHLCNIPIERTIYGIENLRRLLIHKKKVKNELHYKNIEVTIERGKRWLENQQRADGSIGKIEPRQWEIWDTANAALALIETDGDKTCIDNAVNFILGGQLKNGSFYFNYVPKSLKENRYCNCIETVCVALLAAYTNEKRISENVKRGMEFLIKVQDEDGSWELPYLRGISKYPSVTGYALKTLLHIKVYPEKTLQKAISFLETAQQKNGSWGRASEYYNTESYAIKNISDALILARDEGWLTKEEKGKVDKMLQRCISYVIKKQNSDGSWSAMGQSSKCISTALYLQTLLNVSDMMDEKATEQIKAAAHFLLEKQRKNGFWYGGKLGKYNADFFATSESLIALNRASQYMQ